MGINPLTTLYTLPHLHHVTWQHDIFFNIYILYALYDSHEQENDVTKEIRGNQIGAI
jgi:hypothetical protein